MKGKRKYIAFWGCLVAAFALTLLAVATANEAAQKVGALKAFAEMLPWLLGAFGAANAGEHAAEAYKAKNGGGT